MNAGTEQIYILNPGQTQPLGISQKQATAGTTTVNLENVDNFSNVCRTCATITQLVIPIFSGEGLDHHLAEKIHKHLPINVSETDLLPLVLCYQCVSTLLAWHELVECCLQADRALRSSIGVNCINSNTENDKKATQTITLASSTTVDEDSQTKSYSIGSFVRPPEVPSIRDPPKYTPPHQLCDFCNTAYPEDTFIKHLIVEHSELLFHCEQCDKYLNRRQFITHMSLHSVQYTGQIQLGTGVGEEIGVHANNSNGPSEPQCGRVETIEKEETFSEIKQVEAQDSNTTIISIARSKNVNVPAPVAYSKLPIKTSEDTEANVSLVKNKNAANSAKRKKAQTTISTTIRNPQNKSKDLATGTKNTTANSNEITVPTAITSKPTLVKRNPTINSEKNHVTTCKSPSKSVSQTPKTSKYNEENEFSDHSDMEYGLGPLPESVFEAIEDTQDSEPAEDTSQTLDIEYIEEKSNLETKDKNFKVPTSKKPRICPICSKVYRASSSYFYHLKHTHQRVKEHECDICAKKFATRASLAVHTTTHTGESQFECKHCKKRFRTNASLYIHEQTHTGIKTFSCKQCDTSFRWRTHLLRHMKRHSAEKAHVCTVCGRGFNIRCDLLRHTRTHAAGEYSCDQCDVKFAQLRYLKVHKDRKHSKKAEKK